MKWKKHLSEQAKLIIPKQRIFQISLFSYKPTTLHLGVGYGSSAPTPNPHPSDSVVCWNALIRICFYHNSSPSKNKNLIIILYYCPLTLSYTRNFVETNFCFCKSVGSGSTSSSGLTGNYIPSFLKKEVGSAVQRVHLAPIPDPSPGKFHCGLFMN